MRSLVQISLVAALGLLTILPTLLLLLLWIAAFAAPELNLTFLVPMFLGSVALLFVPMIYYIVALIRRERPSTHRTAWILALIAWFPFAGPIFWYRHVLHGWKVLGDLRPRGEPDRNV